jgi:hypothetical protein
MIQFFARRVRSVGTMALLPVALFVSVDAQAAAPKITGTPTTTVVVGNAYTFTPSATDADGNKLTYSIANKPGFAQFSATTGQMSGTPFAEHERVWSGIVISVSDGTSKVSLPSFSLTVKANPNKSPTITGTPAATAKVGTAYSFKPTAIDPEGKALTFKILNKPTWAIFDRVTGLLSGTPTATGATSSIVIYVTDGVSSASLMPSFSITVSAAAVANAAPTISGTPSITAQVGVPYIFKPSASDANRDALTFSVQNKPIWATFNTTTGELSGTPTSTGTTSDVLIKVSDGKASASLSAFTLVVSPGLSRTASLSWVPPTQYTDGTTMTNLAGYRIRYGRSATDLSASLSIDNAGITRYSMDGLASGVWFFAIVAYTSEGAESANSTVISATVL